MTTDIRTQSNRLYIECQRLRTDAIRTRLELAGTFCSVAEMENRCYGKDQAREVLTTARRELEDIAQHLHEPLYVSPECLRDLQLIMSRLRQRVQRIQSSLSH